MLSNFIPHKVQWHKMTYRQCVSGTTLITCLKLTSVKCHGIKWHTDIVCYLNHTSGTNFSHIVYRQFSFSSVEVYQLLNNYFLQNLIQSMKFTSWIY